MGMEGVNSEGYKNKKPAASAGFKDFDDGLP